MARVQRNAVVERWVGREWAVREDREGIAKALADARKAGDVRNTTLLFGQDAGLIDSIAPAAELVESIAAEAYEIIRGRMSGLLRT
jgi:NAD(P)H-dependent flavin oxidoreductase YrpB (nitropropane dioxygenase family)